MEEIGNTLGGMNDKLRELPIGEMCTYFAGTSLEVTGSEPFANDIALLEQRIDSLRGPCLNNSTAIGAVAARAYDSLQALGSKNDHVAKAQRAALGLTLDTEKHDEAADNMIDLAERIIECLRAAGELVRYYNASHDDAQKKLKATDGKRDKIISETEAYLGETGITPDNQQ
ncbi:MAG TPA: hypothetical protein VMR45_04640 [Patescibacteria group bacterium]|nr:hypothetical protein [Patescibacteria group bacterium]